MFNADVEYINRFSSLGYQTNDDMCSLESVNVRPLSRGVGSISSVDPPLAFCISYKESILLSLHKTPRKLRLKFKNVMNRTISILRILSLLSGAP